MEIFYQIRFPLPRHVYICITLTKLASTSGLAGNLLMVGTVNKEQSEERGVSRADPLQTGSSGEDRSAKAVSES